MKSKLESYSCFAAVLCIVISSGIAGYAIVGIFAPELTMDTETYNSYQSNDSYWNFVTNLCKESDDFDEKDKENEKEKKVKPNEDELTKQRLEAFSLALKNEKRDCLQSFIQCLMYILTSSLVLLIFWKILKKPDENLRQ